MFWQNLESDEHCSSLLTMANDNRHLPVMVSETLKCLDVIPGKNFLDLTLGGGGHADAILKASAPDGKLIGADRDLEAIGRAQARLSEYGNRVITVHNSIGNVAETLSLIKNIPIHGALIDCGVSSNQLDDGKRGFSLSQAGPLDMRMDTSQPFSAKEWLSRVNETDLANTIFEFGEERHSRKIASAIVHARKKGEIKTTLDLAEVVRRAVPSGARYGRIHPATRTFQAIRIVINDELGQLRKGLNFLLAQLSIGARIVVIAFHSLEDRIVKDLFREAEGEGKGKILTKKPLVPTESETARNVRSRSAKLRALQIVGGKA